MPLRSAFKAPFFCDQCYHLVFKSIDGLLLFKNDNNRVFFLEKFAFYTQSIFICFAWCQLDNHVHFIVRTPSRLSLQQSILELAELEKSIAMRKFLLDPMNDLLIDELIERQVNRFMIAYTNSFNKMFNRTGSLFQSFRRSNISSEAHLQQAIIYVHANAQKHGLIEDYQLYPHASFNGILRNKPSFVDSKAVLRFFGGLANFSEQHQAQVAYYYSNHWPNSAIEV
jgi:putative transposase